VTYNKRESSTRHTASERSVFRLRELKVRFMRIGTRITLGFAIILLILVSLIGSTMLLGVKIADARDHTEREIGELDDIDELIVVLREEQSLHVRYIATDNETLMASILAEEEELHGHRDGIIDHLFEELANDPETFSAFEDAMATLEMMDGIFGDLVGQRTGKAANESLTENVTASIADARHAIRDDFFSNPSYAPALSEYHNVSGENTTAYALFHRMGYLEKEYIWQYKDQGHLDELRGTVSALEDIIPMTALDPAVRDDMVEALGTYLERVDSLLPLFEEYDIAKLTARNSKIERNIWILKHDDLRDEWMDNPAYGDLFYVYREYTVNGTPHNKSMEQLYYELGHHEKEVMYQDHGEQTLHHDELVATVSECKAYVDAAPLNVSEKAELKGLFDAFVDHIDEYMDNHEKLHVSYHILEEEKLDQIAVLDELLDEVLVGGGSGDDAGLGDTKAHIMAEVEAAEEVEAAARSMISVIGIILTILALAMAVVMRVVLARTVVRPICELTETARKVVYENEVDTPIDIHRDDEIGELAEMYRRLINTTKNAMLILEQQEDTKGNGR